jgi:hypothetical protein
MERKTNHATTPKGEQSPMTKPREMAPIMTQAADPLGSYTGTPAGAENTQAGKTPVQDADDL